MKQEDQIKEVFSYYRNLLLSTLEISLMGAPEWSIVRKQVLQILSPDRGLEHKVLALLTKKGE